MPEMQPALVRMCIFREYEMMKKRKNIMLRLISVAAFAALIFSLPGCSGIGNGSSAKSDDNRNEDGTYFDNGETFCRGVWAVDDGEKRTGYYRANGRFVDAQLGMDVPFSVDVKENAAVFHLGAADFTDSTTVENTGKGKRTVTWTNENREEYLTLLGGQEPDTFSSYSRNDLGEMAMDYYEIQNEVRPESVVINISADGMASIQLYDKAGNEIAGYDVDSITGKGTVKDSEEKITLVRRTTDD